MEEIEAKRVPRGDILPVCKGTYRPLFKQSSVHETERR